MPPGPAPMQQPERQPIPGVKNLVAVASGKGGVGKTTVAVNVALALARLGHKVGLLDADVYGPNVPLMMNATAQPRLLERNMIEPLDQLGGAVLGGGGLTPGVRPRMCRGPRRHSITRHFCKQ